MVYQELFKIIVFLCLLLQLQAFTTFPRNGHYYTSPKAKMASSFKQRNTRIVSSLIPFMGDLKGHIVGNPFKHGNVQVLVFSTWNVCAADNREYQTLSVECRTSILTAGKIKFMTLVRNNHNNIIPHQTDSNDNRCTFMFKRFSLCNIFFFVLVKQQPQQGKRTKRTSHLNKYETIEVLCET